jgi:hypothetical protein
METQEQTEVMEATQKHIASLQGALTPEQANAINSSASSATTAYAANGSVASLIFYQKWQVAIKGGKTFNGNAGGISTPGGGALFGTVYTSDINRLYNDTRSFSFNSASVYINVLFYDKHSNYLGTFQAGGVSTVVGTGGGTGKWSK